MIKRVLNWTKWCTISLITLLIVLILAIIGLLYTNAGLSVALWGAQKALPQLTVESSTGAIFPRFSLNNVRYQDESLFIDTKLKQVTLAINPSCFLEPKVCITELAVDGLDFSMPQLAPSEPAPDSPESTGNTRFRMPIPINVGRLALSDIQLDILGTQVGWQSFTTSASMVRHRLRIGDTNWQNIYLELAKSEPSEPKPKNSTATPPTPIKLPEVFIPINVDIKRFDVNQFTLQQEQPLVVNHLGLEGSAGDFNVDIRRIELDMPQVSADALAKVELKQGYPLELELNSLIKQTDLKGQAIHLSASGSVEKLQAEAELKGAIGAKLVAKLQPLQPELPFDVQLKQGQVQWPIQGKGDYVVEQLELTTKGSLEGYSLDLDSQISGAQLPDMTLTARGYGTLSDIDIQQIDLATLGGHVAGAIKANWDTPVSWAADLSLSDIQPGLQWPQAEGSLSGKLATTGGLTEQGGWQVDLPLLDIDGLLRNYPLNLEGSLKASDIQGTGELLVTTPKLVLAHGENKLEVAGELDKTWDMNAKLHLPDLAKSIPDLSGRVEGDVKLAGKMQQPDVKLDLRADGIHWQDQAALEQLTLQGSVHTAPNLSADLTLNAYQLAYQDQLVDSIKLDVSGGEESHQVALDVISELVSTSLLITGSLQQSPSLIWSGQLERLSLTSMQGPWRLEHPTLITVDVDKQQANIAAHCWLQAGSSLCLDKDTTVGKNGEAALSIKQFDFAQIKSLLPHQTEIQGLVDAQIWAKWAESQPPEVKVNVQLPKGHVEQTIEQPIVLGWESIELNAELKQDRLDADWMIDVVDNGDLSGRISIPDVLAKNKQIDGALKLTPFSLDFLSPIVGDFSKLKSTLETDVTFSGPILQPKVQGRLTVSDILLKGDISPVDVNSGQLTLDLNGYEAELNAGIQTPDGELKLAGEADWQDIEDWRAHLRVFADELLVKVPPIVQVKVVPDMTISATPTLAKIEGDIGLPWGRIVVEELPPNAVSVSKDQVILDESLQPVDGSGSLPLNIETNVNITIGDDFKLSAFGLEGGLKGQLNVTQKDKGPFITGEVNIVDGSYRSFGQDLLIEEGKILMNGPADQPYVAITAIRNPDNTQDDVTAGVRVTGPADEPSLTIFSDPAMPQANALSYLLRGQDIDAETGGNTMTTTLIGLSLAKSGRLVGEIGQAFGVQDLQLDTAGTGDDSQVTVSGYVLPGLKVQYGVGIFEPVGEFTVRYRLMTDLYVEVVSGLDNAVDLLYQFEFD
ncbi:autotransporter assembly complex protein TamB [Vibrio paucivorans]